MVQVQKIKFEQIPDKQNTEVYTLLKKIIKKANVQPILIGISGHAHTGKKTLAKNFSKMLSPRRTIILDTADYNFPRCYRFLSQLTGANPAGVNLAVLKKDISELSSGKPILKPKYSHTTGKILKSIITKPRPIIIIIGLAAFHKQLGIKYDIKYFIDITGNARWNFTHRIKRAVGERGYTKREAIYWEKIQDRDYKKYALPHKKDADLVYSLNKNYKLTLVRMSPRIKKLLSK